MDCKSHEWRKRAGLAIFWWCLGVHHKHTQRSPGSVLEHTNSGTLCWPQLSFSEHQERAVWQCLQEHHPHFGFYSSFPGSTVKLLLALPTSSHPPFLLPGWREAWAPCSQQLPLSGCLTALVQVPTARGDRACAVTPHQELGAHPSPIQGSLCVTCPYGEGFPLWRKGLSVSSACILSTASIIPGGY